MTGIFVQLLWLFCEGKWGCTAVLPANCRLFLFLNRGIGVNRIWVVIGRIVPPCIFAGLKLTTLEVSQDLIEKALGGHQQAFGVMFRQWYSPLCSYAASFVRDRDEAEEIVQASFITVWEKRTELRIESSLKSYMYRAVRNACLNRIKHEKVRKEYASEVKVISGIPMNEPASGQLFTGELERKIGESLDKLPEQCRVVFELSRFGELKYAEIAEKLGISVKTVENQVGKALRIMREELKDYLPLILVIMKGFLDEWNY